MNATDQINDYLATQSEWREELTALRQIALDAGLSEAWKWRQPCFTWEGHNVCIIGTLSHACVIGFFKGALLEDPTNLLAPPGPNTRSAKDARFTSLDQIRAAEPTLRNLIAQATAVEQAGLQVDFSDRDDIPVPEELTARIDSDPGFAAAWDALTPGRKRAYCLTIGQAKQPKTRLARIDKYAAKIHQGLGPNDH